MVVLVFFTKIVTLVYRWMINVKLITDFLSYYISFLLAKQLIFVNL